LSHPKPSLGLRIIRILRSLGRPCKSFTLIEDYISNASISLEFRAEFHRQFAGVLKDLNKPAHVIIPALNAALAACELAYGAKHTRTLKARKELYSVTRQGEIKNEIACNGGSEKDGVVLAEQEDGGIEVEAEADVDVGVAVGKLVRAPQCKRKRENEVGKVEEREGETGALLEKRQRRGAVSS
jgi:hypothetical protein